METSTKEKTIFERLGGIEGITSIVDDIVEAHMNNPIIKSRFLPLKDDPKHFSMVRMHLINFLASGTGGKDAYTGKDMFAAHRGMNISEAEYMTTIDDILLTLDKHHIDEKTKNDVLVIVYSMKDQIIRA